MDKSMIFLIGFLVYTCIMIFIGWKVSLKQKTGDDFLMGDRNIPLFLLLGTMVATLIGTGSSMGAVGFGYKNGFAGALYGIGGGIGTLLLSFLFTDARKKNFMTMSEELSYYYGANKLIKGVVAILIYIASVGWLGAHILGGSMYLSWIAKIDLTTAKIITVLGFGVYVAIGGYLAVVWTDLIQAIVLFTGFIAMAFAAIPAAGGWSNIVKHADPKALSFLGIEKYGLIPAISLSLVIGVGVLATPSYRHRIYSGKDEQTVKKSFRLSALFYFLFSIIPAIIGISAFALNSKLENTNYAFPFMATEVLPVWFGLLVLIAGLSATMSSGDSDAMAGVTILLRDVYVLFKGKMPPEDKMIKYSRISVVITLGIAFLFSVTATNVISYITNMISTCMTGLFVCAILGKLWNRSTWQGGLGAIVGGSAVSFYMLSSPDLLKFWGNPVIPSILGALAAGVVISLVTPKKTISSDEALEILNSERNSMKTNL